MPGPPIYEDWWTGDWWSFEELPLPAPNADESYLSSAKGVPRENIFDAGCGERVERLVLDDVARVAVHEEATTAARNKR